LQITHVFLFPSVVFRTKKKEKKNANATVSVTTAALLTRVENSWL